MLSPAWASPPLSPQSTHRPIAYSWRRGIATADAQGPCQSSPVYIDTCDNELQCSSPYPYVSDQQDTSSTYAPCAAYAATPLGLCCVVPAPVAMAALSSTSHAKPPPRTIDLASGSPHFTSHAPSQPARSPMMHDAVPTDSGRRSEPFAGSAQEHRRKVYGAASVSVEESPVTSSSVELPPTNAVHQMSSAGDASPYDHLHPHQQARPQHYDTIMQSPAIDHRARSLTDPVPRRIYIAPLQTQAQTQIDAEQQQAAGSPVLASPEAIHQGLFSTHVPATPAGSFGAGPEQSHRHVPPPLTTNAISAGQEASAFVPASPYGNPPPSAPLRYRYQMQHGPPQAGPSHIAYSSHHPYHPNHQQHASTSSHHHHYAQIHYSTNAQATAHSPVYHHALPYPHASHTHYPYSHHRHTVRGDFESGTPSIPSYSSSYGESSGRSKRGRHSRGEKDHLADASQSLSPEPQATAKPTHQRTLQQRLRARLAGLLLPL